MNILNTLTKKRFTYLDMAFIQAATTTLMRGEFVKTAVILMVGVIIAVTVQIKNKTKINRDAKW